jgi:hypothetical protein
VHLLGTALFFADSIADDDDLHAPGAADLQKVVNLFDEKK